MWEQYVTDGEAVECLRSGSLGPYLGSFVASLEGLGYASSTMRSQLRLLVDFSRWSASNELAAADLSEQHVDTFLDERRDQSRLDRSDRPTLRRFLEHLREEGIVPPAVPPCEASPLSDIESRYENYLRTERGLTQLTVDNYWPYARRLLVEHFDDESLRLRELAPADVTGFVLRHAHSMSSGRAQIMVTALRSFFRFLFERGELESNLAISVPSVANWRLTSVPKFLTPEEVGLLLTSCDQSTTTGRRDYAILLLLSRLGLRSGEVVGLELDDIDWRAGEITIKGKGLVHDRLPLLSDVGEALATYLRHDRPQSPTRRLFLRMKAPRRGFAGPSTVTTIVRSALERADLHPPFKGAQILRHSLATSMLRRGASMAEIGEVLRHRVPQTTEIYAKVDFNNLRSLAQPWPGSGAGR